ncbi:recombinase family protein [Gemmiger formicilis]|uniref:recombinase family protein n=2 Tax=Gemmiger formicilis TaxID=745368 RepID=UPI003CCB1CC4
MPQVQVIQPIQQQPKRLRVAAYARVSSDSEDQLNSLAVQVDYYTHLIQENPNWEFAGIYTDEGITGTSTKRREQFNRLMDDCRAGLIDRVLVKSASRFARNTADALSSVRELKSLGVTVAFEKEGFDTETSNGEMLLSIICAVAQEESLSISQNMKWGIHKRMRTGNYITNATPFGYTQINHQLVPEKNNAMIVNDIFKSYLSGMSINEIAEHLNTIYPKENSKWNPRTIHAILRNEKYIGDSLYQKTYTTDSLPLKRYLNTGQRSKYYAMETHEGIISKTDYEKVQNLLAKKSITDEVAAQLDGILRQMKAGENLKAQLQKQLEKAQQEFDRLLEMSLELDESTPFLDDKLRKLSGKIKILKANIAESTDGKGEDEEATKQLTAQDLLIKEYDDILTARIIEKVIVHSRQEIEIYFIGGYTQKIDLI